MTADGTPRHLYEWFAGTARRHPDAVALEVAGEAHTYAELDALAGRLAAALLDVGSTRPARVGLLAARTLTAYAGYLAAQRIGATVVPLNPAFPAARNAAVTAAAGLDLVLADSDRADAELPAPVCAFDAADPAFATGGADAPPPADPGPEDVAYILFTSGSTGTPKGVPIQHRNVSAYLDHVIPRYELGVGSRLSQTFDLTFDLSVFDLFAAWGSGATLVVPEASDVLAPVRYVNRARLTHWFSVPSVISFAMRLRGLAPDSMPTLRWSLFCGEPLTAAQAAAWTAAASGSVLENLYGPTELTLSCTQFRLPGGTEIREEAGETVPIGDLYPGLEQLVVDEDGRPAAEGELCVRGVQRFPGYLAPQDNVGRFLRYEGERATVVQESAPPDERLWYRTGDRVRVRDRGLVHLGRLDQQVKVRGYRVELGEIEAMLRAQPGVRDAVVVAIPKPRGDSALAAACTGDDSDPERLLAAVRAALPSYMVPDTLTPFDRFPLNANGKIDRRALERALAPANGVAR
ncbi:amino acid adenylation domain-containing protein [Streptomyces sp. NPDC041068]|uniref:amino acid adenylation domain-containing protein n=1 Tax=Streptomyces sp. NPDC041068 TaxID=3155130 RepID=UPI0033CB3125